MSLWSNIGQCWRDISNNISPILFTTLDRYFANIACYQGSYWQYQPYADIRGGSPDMGRQAVKRQRGCRQGRFSVISLAIIIIIIIIIFFFTPGSKDPGG